LEELLVIYQASPESIHWQSSSSKRESSRRAGGISTHARSDTTIREQTMAEAGYKGKRVEVEIHADTYKIRGMLFIPLAGEGGYSSRLSDFLNNPDKHFLALTDVKVEALPGTQSEMGRAVSRRQQKRGYDGESD